MTGKNFEVQIEALSAAVNLGLGTEDHCHEVASKLGSYLIVHMSSGNLVLQVS